jgi:hypothetical protein
MTYEEIKSNLAKAEQLALSGKVSDADALVRSMLGKGLSPMDLRNNLSAKAMRALRSFAKQ